MEYLSRLLATLDKRAGFYHHPKCHRIGLKHILFADDLILFSSGRCSSILAIKDTVEQFLRSSGLAINMEKSQVFTTGMPASKSVWVEGVLGTSIAELPVRFLWRVTVAGGKGSFLVSWKEVCKNKQEGGLGLSNLSTLNVAMRLNHLWKFSIVSDNIWHSWVRRAPNSWHLLIPWFNSMKQQALRTRMLAATISMAAYEVWRARNAKKLPSVERAVRRVVWFLKMKITAIDCTNVTLEDRDWCHALGFYRQSEMKGVGKEKLHRNVGLSIYNDSQVYDVTEFMDDHPRGRDVLLTSTGKDATEDFEDVGHIKAAREQLELHWGD
ncbi:hypothetical protein QQ045_027958 [Rhodiola kirilowii]